MNILAVQLKRIGDLILTTPALHGLKHGGAAGNARVTLALTENTAPLLPALAGAVDEALVIPKHGSLTRTLALWRGVRRGNFDVCVDLTGNDRSALLTSLSGAPRRVIARDALRRASGWRAWAYNTFVETNVRVRHTVDRGLDHVPPALGRAVPDDGEGGDPPAPVLHLPAAARAQAREALAACGIRPGERFAVVHPGSARAEKYWRPERWAETLHFLQEELGVPVVLTGGRGDPFEDTHLAAVRAATGRPGVRADLAGKLDLLALASVTAEAAVFCGVDSGPMHLAAAASVPCVVLFGPTNPFHWRPRHPGALVLQAGRGDAPVVGFDPISPGGAMEAIPTAAVTGALRRLLG